MKSSTDIRIKGFSIITGVVLIVGLVMNLTTSSSHQAATSSDVVEEINQVLTQHQQQSATLFSTLAELQPKDYHHWLEHNGLIGHADTEIGVQENNQYTYWSGNAHALPDSLIQGLSVTHSHGQWLGVYAQEIGSKWFCSTYLLAKSSPVTNDYLKRRNGRLFTNSFQLDDVARSGYEEVNLLGTPAYIRPDRQSDKTLPYDTRDTGLLLFFLGAAFLFYLQLLYAKQSLWRIALFLLLMVGLRSLTVVMGKSINTGLFSSTIYASSNLFPSLADLWQNVVFGLFVMEGLYGLMRYLGRYKIYGVMTVFLVLSYLATDLIAGLVVHSSIPFNVGNIPELNMYSFVGITCMAGLMFILYRSLIRLTSAAQSVSSKVSVALWSLAMIGVVIWGIKGTEGYAAVWIGLLLALSGLRLFSTVKRFAGGWAYVMVFAAYAGVTVTSAAQLQLVSQESLLKRKVLSQQDPLGELLYQDFERQLIEKFGNGDRSQLSIADFASPTAIELEQQLKAILPSHFGRYEFHAYVFDSTGAAVHPVSGDRRKHRLAYFKQLVGTHGQPATTSNLYAILHSAEVETYVAMLQLKDGVVVTTLASQMLPMGIGFPELLKDKGNDLSVDFNTFSFGLYREGELLKAAGNYLYPVNPSLIKHASQHHQNAGYIHNTFDLPDGLLVITHKEKDWINTVTTFSYFFLILGGLGLLLSLIKSTLDNQLSLELNFNQKIRFSLVALVLLALVIFGWITTGYITSQWETKNANNVHEKIRSVQIEVEHKLGARSSLVDEDPDYLSYLLSKFSAVFFTDITLFDLSGNLIATSRPTLFAEGLLADRMNAEALHTMSHGNMSAYMQEEKLGDFNYVSAYVPFRNKKGETLAYLNLPYFAKQGELGTEISSFLVAFINICVLLFALTVIGALVVTNILTKPLRLIQDTIESLDIGKVNQPIAYQGHDEIGELIAAYNLKVNELEKNAVLLAKSEREGAWREMAKQVAHEIKNPLTPMKLNVQMMDRAWKEKAEDWDQRWSKFATSMVEQIDTLSSIASAFSNFAQMPGTSLERFDLKPLAESVTGLYSNDQVRVVFDTELEQAMVKGDKDQIGRVIQNVVKNGVQAIPNTQEGKVTVKLIEKSEFFQLIIADNGSGIPLEQQDKIFEPNFTTKTSGTGLGLAMVKSIVDQHEGSITFVSSPKGTAFTITLKKPANE